MKHLGNITKINGAEIEPVDCITGGSPCQDLSVAGKRAGLAGERSGLFMEQIRVVKEMRDHDRSIGRSSVAVRPRYMVWENVPGAFSSNHGKDFQAVLTEIVRVVEPEAPDVPMPDKGWPKAGCLYDEMGKVSVSWRLHDAQFWGVAQRRKRIALVADFGGMSAPEILFERKGLSRDTETGGETRESSAGAVEDRTGTASYTVRERAGCAGGGKGALVQTEKSATLSTLQDQTLFCIQGSMIGRADKNGPQGDGVNEDVCFTENATDRHAVAYNIGAFESNAWKSKNPNSGVYETDKSKTLDALNFASPTCNQGGTAVVQFLDMTHANDVIRECGETAPTLQSRMGTGGNQVQLVETYQYTTGPLMANSHPGSYTGQDAYSDMLVVGLDCRNGCENAEISSTLQAHNGGGYSLNCTHPVRIGSIVRRLTPMECERLQGFPDGWTDIGEWTDSNGKLHKPSDTPRYKALGNSIAVGYANRQSGFWCWLTKRISAQYERTATLGSLFDGIGGFPLAWEAVNGKGSARWASEIEEFPIAVTKYHFPE